MSSGTTAVLLYTTHLTWATPGDSEFPPLEHPRTSDLTVTRNYVTQDILRRIMSDYFGYDVHFVMNVTDIDDKVLSSRSVMVAKTLKSSNFAFTDNHTGQAESSSSGIPSQQFGTDAPASG